MQLNHIKYPQNQSIQELIPKTVSGFGEAIVSMPFKREMAVDQ